MMISCLAAIILLLSSATSHDCWIQQESGVTVSLRGVSAVDEMICWASGAGGTVLRTDDGGTTWVMVSPVGFESCDFRDVQAFSGLEAVIMSSGELDVVLRTEDGGETWQTVYEHPDRDAFFDCLVFWDQSRGMLMGDPIDGHLFLAKTTDGGRTWEVVDRETAPTVDAGEAGFAASGTNVCVAGDGLIWIGLGGAVAGQSFAHSHVWRSEDYGQTWQVHTAPLSRSPTRGIFSIAAASENHLVAVGGDFANPDLAVGHVAFSSDGGRTWLAPKQDPPRGYRSAVAVVPGTRPPRWLATGPTGTDTSQDFGNSWNVASTEGFHAMSFAPVDGVAGWAVGSDGRIAKYRPH